MANSINKSVKKTKENGKNISTLKSEKIEFEKIKNTEQSKFKKRILILSWEMFPLYAGGLGFLTKSVVDEMKRQNCFVQVLCPFIPKNLTIEAISLEKRIKFWCCF